MRVISSETLYQGRLKAVRDTIEQSEGVRYTHETIVHPGAVVIMPITASGSIVFVEQYRHSIKKNFLELPAGTLEAGEDPAVCAERELAEEVGLAPRSLIPMGVLYPAPGFCSEVQYLYCAKDLYERKATPDEDEVITIVELTPREVSDAITSGRLSDAKSLALILRAQMTDILKVI